VRAPSDTGLRVLVRLSGEVSTKARMTRRGFVTRLVRNLRDALDAEGGGSVERRHDRLFVTLERPEALAALERVYGVQSLSLAQRHPGEKLDAVVEAGERAFAESVRGRRFAVRARVVGGDRQARAFRGRDVEVALGARLLPLSAGVDLSAPEVTAGVEIHEGHAYLFVETRPGAGGLPLGAGGRAVALVSGGFDSPVAAWHVLRRGIALDYVFCNLGGATHRLGALRVMKVIADRWSYGSRPRLHAVDFQEAARALQERCEPRYWQVILKRLMLRAAERVAREQRAEAIVTGESLGQVSSQTLANLAVISEAVALPILRPLVGMHKEEIIRRAREIGTAELSAAVDEYCALAPRRPATQARAEIVREQEARLDPAPLERAVAAREVLDLRAVDADDTGLPELEIRTVPPGAVVVDLRPRAEWRAWHWPDSVPLGFAEALAAAPSLPKERTYVLVCELGLRSAHLAEMLQRAGLRAFHLRGGLRALRRLAEDAAPQAR
jgi:thiamine biosynthesis protein ThiI